MKRQDLVAPCVLRDYAGDDGALLLQAPGWPDDPAPVLVVRSREPHGVVVGVEITLTINDRTAPVATAWHYEDEDAAPRLVTAYPST